MKRLLQSGCLAILALISTSPSWAHVTGVGHGHPHDETLSFAGLGDGAVLLAIVAGVGGLLLLRHLASASRRRAP